MIFMAAALSFARGEDERLLLTHVAYCLRFSQHAAFTQGDLLVGIKRSQRALIGREHCLLERIRDWESSLQVGFSLPSDFQQAI